MSWASWSDGFGDVSAKVCPNAANCMTGAGAIQYFLFFWSSQLYWSSPNTWIS
jgi:hypothetical protein